MFLLRTQTIETLFTRQKSFMRKSLEAERPSSKEKYLARLNLTPSQQADLEKYVRCIKEEHSAELWQSFQQHLQAINPHLRLVYGPSPLPASSTDARPKESKDEDRSHHSTKTNPSHESALSDLLLKVQMDNQDLLLSADTMFIEPAQLKILSYSPSESRKKKRFPQFELSEAFSSLSKIPPPRSIYVAQRLVWEAYSIFHYKYDHQLYKNNIDHALGYPTDAPESRPSRPRFTMPVDLPTSRNGHLVAPNANLHRHIHNIRRYHKCIDNFRACLYYCCGGSPFNFFQRHFQFQIKPLNSKTGNFKCLACEMREGEKSEQKRTLDHSTQ